MTTPSYVAGAVAHDVYAQLSCVAKPRRICSWLGRPRSISNCQRTGRELPRHQVRQTKSPGIFRCTGPAELSSYERDLSHSSPRQPQLHVGCKTLYRNGRIKLAQGPWLQPACCAVNTLPAERKRLRRHALAGRDSVAGYLIVQKHV